MASLCCLRYPSEETPDPTYLDYDPAEYTVTLVRRSSSHPTLSGMVHQDLGVLSADSRINLRTDYMEAATLADFQTKFAVLGQVWKWDDHEGNTYDVFFIGLNPIHLRGVEAYQVEMVFAVIGGPT
jgi:hypothetical protein